MDALLVGGDEILARLRAQYAVGSVKAREAYDSGADVLFDVPASAHVVDPSNFQIGDIQLRLVNGPSPVDAMIFVKNGRLQSLEYYFCGGEAWPAQPVVETAHYFGAREFSEIGDALFQTRDLAFALNAVKRT